MTALYTRLTTGKIAAYATQTGLAKNLWQVGKRFVFAGIAILVVVSVVFFIMKNLSGGESALNVRNLSDEERAQLAAAYGFDQPLFQQYTNYIDGLFHGTFGLSTTYKGLPVESFVWERIGWSVIIGVIGLVFAALLAWIYAFFISFNPVGVNDKIAQAMVALFQALPPFVLAGILAIVMSTNPNYPLLFDRTNFVSWVLGILAIAIPYSFSDLWRMRAYIQVIHREQFIKFAQLKGVARWKIVVKHVIPHSLIPLTVSFPVAIAGSVTITILFEAIIGLPGAGSVLSSAINAKDYNVVLSIILVQVFFNSFAFAFQDVLGRLIDPRRRRRS